jgi:hypothetical protein
LGDTLTYDPGCADPLTKWYLIDATTGTRTEVSAGVAAPYIVSATGEAAGLRVEAVGSCPDPSAPSGYGEEIDSCREEKEPDPSAEFTAPFYADGQVGQFNYQVSVGVGPGTVIFSWNGGGSIPDTFTLSGAVSFSINTAENGSVTLTKVGSQAIVDIAVAAPLSGTAWSFEISATTPA